MRNQYQQRYERPCRFATLAAIMLAGFAGNCRLQAQSPYSTAADEFQRAGFGIYTVSLVSSFSYITSPVLNQNTGLIDPNVGYHSFFSGVSGAVGWRSRRSDTFHFAVRYSGSFDYDASSYGGSGFIPGQQVSMDMRKKIGNKWIITASLAGSMGNVNQLLLSPNVNQDLSEAPGTASDFGEGIVGEPTGATSPLTAQESLLYGAQILNLAARFSAAYKPTSRFTIMATAGSSREQHLGIGSSSDQIPNAISQSTGLSAGLAMSYSLSPLTSLVANISYARAESSLETAPSTSVSVGATRRLTEHLFARATAGTGFILPHGQGASAVGFQGTVWEASGSIGYRVLQQSFVATASRSASDNYGVGSDDTIMAAIGWGWRPRGSAWGVNAGASETRLEGSEFGRNGYSLNGGIRRRLGTRFTASMSFGYGAFSVGGGQVVGLTGPVTFKSESVSLALSWHPYLGRPDMDSVPADVP
jgi:hypothetical protein